MAAVGDPGRPPLAPPGAQARFVAGLYAAVEALASPALGSEPSGGLVDLSVAEAVLATTIYDAVAFQYHGLARERVGRRYARQQPLLATLPCADGWIGLHVALHSQWRTLCQVIGHPELMDDERFRDPSSRALNIAALDALYLEPWLRQRTRWQAYHDLQAARIPCSALPTVEEVLASPQLAARHAWRNVRTPAGRNLRVPGPPARLLMEGTSGARRNGQHEIGPWEPGKLRVVDLSMGWAGPMVSHILAFHGADVIKVESHRRFDWWRGSRPPGDDPALALHERSHVFNGVNRGKRGITLDLATQAGLEIVHRLLRDADVVVENFAAGVLEKMGLSYEALSAENPGLVMLRLPAFGSTGPEADYVAFGNTIEGMSGLTSLIGYEAAGPPYMLSNALGDPVGGLNGTIAVMAALHARQRDGKGRCIEVAQFEGFLPLVSEALLDYQRSRVVPVPTPAGRVDEGVRGVFSCAGDDRWIAIDASTVETLRRLTLVAPAGGGVPDAAAVAAWAAQFDRDELVSRLVTAGVPAAPVNGEADALASDLFAGRGFWLAEDRAVVGLHLYPSLPFLRSGERLSPGRPAPTLGEHNREVLEGLGFEPAAIDRLATEGIIGQTPAVNSPGALDAEATRPKSLDAAGASATSSPL
jgi:crotonobetainyl-CoA:carnitine CoA-transferase CaiB-like acyl-CoA transferase